MKLLHWLATLCLVSFITSTVNGDLIILGTIDGDLPGGRPKAILFQATEDIADLSLYGFGSATNGRGSDGEEFSFASGSASEGEILVIGAGGNTTSFFGTYFANLQTFQSSAANIDGDDAIELFENGSVIDTYGEIDVDGSGTTWDYQDGYARRTGGSAGIFIQANYSSNAGLLDGLDEAGTASALDLAFGLTSVPEPGALAMLSLLSLLSLRRRRIQA